MDPQRMHQHILEVKLDISDNIFTQLGSNAAFRENIKRNLSSKIAEGIYDKTTFTQMRDPTTDNIIVIGRVAVMQIDDYKKLLSTLPR